MSLHRSEPGEYGWQSHTVDGDRARHAPRAAWERYGPTVGTLEPGETRSEAVEADRAACRDENARLDAQER